MPKRALVLANLSAANRMASALSAAGITVVGKATQATEAIKLYKQHKPELAIVDAGLPANAAVDAIGEIMRADPKAVVVASIAPGQEAEALRAVEAGAQEFLLEPEDAGDERPWLKELATLLRKVSAAELKLRSSMPKFITGGKLRDDLSRENNLSGRGGLWLELSREPIGGERLLFELGFRGPMKIAKEPGESDWCMMEGRIRTILQGGNRFIARADAYPKRAPAELAGWWDARFAFDDLLGDWMLESLAPSAAKDASVRKLPDFVIGGFNVEKRARENDIDTKDGRGWLYEGHAPKVGQSLHLELNVKPGVLKRPLPICPAVGRVEQVVDDDELRISALVTVHEELAGWWAGTVVYDPQKDNPWVLTELERASGPASKAP